MAVKLTEARVGAQRKAANRCPMQLAAQSALSAVSLLQPASHRDPLLQVVAEVAAQLAVAVWVSAVQAMESCLEERLAVGLPRLVVEAALGSQAVWH